MTDPETLFAEVADDLARTVAVPPVEQVLVRSRRYRRRLGVPVALVPYAAVAAVVLAVAGTAVVPRLLAGGGRSPVQVSFAHGAPELGTIALPVNTRPTLPEAKGPLPQPVDPDPAVGDRVVLLATATTRLGAARLYGYRTVSGADCMTANYVVPVLNQETTSCWPAGRSDPFDPPIGLTGFGDFTPGTIKSPPVRFGYAPPGTRVVEFSGPGLTTVRAAARDGGEAYGHHAYYLTSFPLTVAGRIRALTADGRVLATVELHGPTAFDIAALCNGSRAVTLSHLQGAVIGGQVWAKDHPATADPDRLRFLNPSAGSTPGHPVLPDAVVLGRLRGAIAAVSLLGPRERTEYRSAAVVIVGDGRACFGAPVLAQAQRLLADTATR